MFLLSTACFSTFGSSLRLTNITGNGQSNADDHRNDDIESQDSTSLKIALNKASKIDARIISDATIGLSDGLTVPFALTAGLSALGNTRVVIYGGLAELIAGAISMGLGGWLGAKSEAVSLRSVSVRDIC
jgi:vacuolar iron transporter family protein